jgi:hypothetical protein
MPSAATDRTIWFGNPKQTIMNAAWLLAETALLPALVLYVFVSHGHQVTGILAALAWRFLAIGARLPLGRTVPTTVWLVAGIFTLRSVIGLAVSVDLYLWIPVILSGLLGTTFLASSFTRTPLTLRCAGDFLHVPEATRADPTVRRVFANLAAWWGCAHITGALVGAWAMRYSTCTTVAIHCVLSVATLAVALTGCAGILLWGARHSAGLRLRPGMPVTA